MSGFQAALAAALSVAACAGAAPTVRDQPAQTITTPSGLKIETLKVGAGDEATRGMGVVVHYVGTLTDGTKFDSSRDRDEPFRFTLGRRQVIKGWDEGVAGMRVGAVRRLTVPPDLAYGEKGFGGGVIPPHATLIFEVELLGVEPGES